MFLKSHAGGCILTLVAVLFGSYYNPSSSSAGAAGKVPDTDVMLKQVSGYRTVQRECTLCHSDKLITQTRATRDGWRQIIGWMQETQNLRIFSARDEKIILDYLSENYAPVFVGRRPPLAVREWYLLYPE